MRRSHRVGSHTVKVACVPRDQKGFEGTPAAGRIQGSSQAANTALISAAT